MKISLASWNVLADCYIYGINKKWDQLNNFNIIPSFSKNNLLYENSLNIEHPLQHLNWDYRKEMLINVMAKVNGDIYCFQEVDHFDDFFDSFLSSIGYSSVFLKRPNKSDGCLIAFKVNKFLLIDVENILLDDIESFAECNAKEKKSKYLKGNVALIVRLASKEDSRDFIVATCHIHWNPNLPNVKLGQVYYILQRLFSFQSKHDNSYHPPLILTGDFNSFPSSHIYRLITSSNINELLNVSDDSKSLEKSFRHFFSRWKRLRDSNSVLYGPDTKFLCDSSLSRLCRWMRVLGIDAALDSWDCSNSHQLTNSEDKNM